MVPNMLLNSARIGQKLVPNVVSTSLIEGYLNLSFLSLNFACPFHS